MTSFRILITGSRTWTDRERIANTLETIDRTQNTERRPVYVIEGEAAGADKLAASVAEEFGWNVIRCPADWSRHDEECPAWHWDLDVCKRAGFRRNVEMVALGADVCAAFIRNRSKGATMTVNLAREAGIPVVVREQNE